MKRYLCPVCDQELIMGKYCRVCKKTVREPIVFEGVLPNEDNGNYLLNHHDIHPGKACIEPNANRDCETPQEERLRQRLNLGVSGTADYSRQTTGSRQSTSAYRTTSSSQSSTSSHQSGTVYQQYDPGRSSAPGSQIWKSGTNVRSGNSSLEPTKKRKSGCGCLVIFLVIWLAGALLTFAFESDWLWNALNGVVEEDHSQRETTGRGEPGSGRGGGSAAASEGAAPETIAPETAVPTKGPENEPAQETSEEETDNVWGDSWDNYDSIWHEADYLDILTEGVACNGRMHYAGLDGKKFYSELVSFAEDELGLVTTGDWETMSNDVYAYAGDDVWTYYDYYLGWDWVDGYIEVTYDSVTGEVHNVVISGEKETAYLLLFHALAELEHSSPAQMNVEFDRLMEGENPQDGALFDLGGTEVWVSQFWGEDYYISLEPAYEY